MRLEKPDVPPGSPFVCVGTPPPREARNLGVRARVDDDVGCDGGFLRGMIVRCEDAMDIVEAVLVAEEVKEAMERLVSVRGTPSS